MTLQATRDLINGESSAELTTLHEDGLKRLCTLVMKASYVASKSIPRNLTETCKRLVQCGVLRCTNQFLRALRMLQTHADSETMTHMNCCYRPQQVGQGKGRRGVAQADPHRHGVWGGLEDPAPQESTHAPLLLGLDHLPVLHCNLCVLCLLPCCSHSGQP